MSPINSTPDHPIWRTKNEAVYLTLRKWILNGELTPGTELEPDVLSAKLQVSITPLREAMRRLQVERFLQTGEHQKVRVSPLTKRELSEIFVMRLNLEPFAAQLCAQHATDDEIATLREIVNREPHGGRELQEMNRRLHSAIYRASSNDLLIRTLDQLWDNAERYRTILETKPVFEDSSREEHHEHEVVVNAIAARDPALASQAMRRHLEESIHEVGRIAGQTAALTES